MKQYQYRVRCHNINGHYIAEVKYWYGWRKLNWFGKVYPLKTPNDMCVVDNLGDAESRVRKHESLVEQGNIKPRWEVVRQYPDYVPRSDV